MTPPASTTAPNAVPALPAATGSVLAPVPGSVAAAPGGNGLKEWVAAFMSIMIVGATFYFMLKMFQQPGTVDGTLWQHQSAILQIAIGLAGTVTGYYFGRIPAERAAANAQQAANSAQQGLVQATGIAQQATASTVRIRTQVGALRTQLSTPLGGGSTEQDTEGQRQYVAGRLDDILRD